MELEAELIVRPNEPLFYPSPTRLGKFLYFQEGEMFVIGLLNPDSGGVYLEEADGIFELAECDGRIYTFSDFGNQVRCVHWSLILDELETLFTLPNRNRNMVAVTIGRSGILVVENRLGMANTIKRYNFDGQLISNTPLNLQLPLRDVCYAGNNRILLNYSPFALPVSYDLIQGAPVNALSSMNQQLRCLTSDLDGHIYGVITLSHTHRLVRINRYTGVTMKTLDIPDMSTEVQICRLRVNAGWVAIQFQEYRVILYKFTDGFNVDTEEVLPCTLS